MKKFTSILSLIIVVAMMASMCVVGTSAAAGDVDAWDGTYDVSWYDPTKTQFTISTAEQLAGMGELSEMGITFDGCAFKLTADIQLNTGDASTWDLVAPANVWTKTIGTKNASFAGSFDGQGHTVSGVYCPPPAPGETGDEYKYRGLFGSVGDVTEMNEVVIENLIVTNSYVGAYINSGIAIGQAIGITKVEDVTVTKSFSWVPGDLYPEKKGTSNTNNGAVVGFANGVSELIINRCAAIDCNLFGWVRTGSIIGGGSGTYMEVNDCYSNSTVNAENRPGGIIGHSSISLVMVNNCIFVGDLINPTTPNYGGIFGGFRADASAEIELQNCYYAGTYTFRGEAVPSRVGSTEIGVLTEGSVYYAADANDISDNPYTTFSGGEKTGNDADGAEVLPTIKGDGAFAAFAAKLDTATWDVTATTATLKPIAVAETPFEAAPVEDTTAAPTEDTTAAPTDDTTAAPADDTTAAPADDTTKAPVSDDTTKAPVSNDTTAAAPAEGGCGGFIGGSIVVACAILGSAWVSKRR